MEFCILVSACLLVLTTRLVNWSNLPRYCTTNTRNLLLQHRGGKETRAPTYETKITQNFAQYFGPSGFELVGNGPIGSGSEGLIYKVQRTGGADKDAVYAMKVVVCSMMDGEVKSQRALLAAGLGFIMPITHDGYSRDTDERFDFITMPLARTLESKGARFGELQMRKIAREMLKHLVAMTRAGYSHNDMGVRNMGVMVGEPTKLIFIDFGSVRKLPSNNARRAWQDYSFLLNFISQSASPGTAKWPGALERIPGAFTTAFLTNLTNALKPITKFATFPAEDRLAMPDVEAAYDKAIELLDEVSPEDAAYSAIPIFLG